MTLISTLQCPPDSYFGQTFRFKWCCREEPNLRNIDGGCQTLPNILGHRSAPPMGICHDNIDVMEAAHRPRRMLGNVPISPKRESVLFFDQIRFILANKSKSDHDVFENSASRPRSPSTSAKIIMATSLGIQRNSRNLGTDFRTKSATGCPSGNLSLAKRITSF